MQNVTLEPASNSSVTPCLPDLHDVTFAS